MIQPSLALGILMRSRAFLTALILVAAALVLLAASDHAVRGAARAREPQSALGVCPGPGTLAGRGQFEEDGSLRLADGRLVVPAGIAWLRAREEEQASGPDLGALRAVLGERDLAFAEREPPDRWGRRSAHLWVPDEESEPVLLAALLLEAGLARAAPEGQPAGCAALLLAVEAKARAAGAGLWPRATVGPWSAVDQTALFRLAGHYALIEGVIASVGESKDRLYLNFGRFRDKGFVVTIRKRNLNRLPDWGKTKDALEGRRVRIRGVVMEGRQLAIDVAGPEQIERLD